MFTPHVSEKVPLTHPLTHSLTHSLTSPTPSTPSPPSITANKFHELDSLRVVATLRVVAQPTRLANGSQPFQRAQAALDGLNNAVSPPPAPRFNDFDVFGEGAASRVWAVQVASPTGSSTASPTSAGAAEASTSSPPGAASAAAMDLDLDLDRPLLVDVVEWNNSGAVFARNWLHDSIDGLRWKSSGGKVVNNTWENALANSATGLEVTPLRSFLEGPLLIEDVRITGNRFAGVKRTQSAELITFCTGMSHRKSPPWKDVCVNATVHGNVYDDDNDDDGRRYGDDDDETMLNTNGTRSTAA